MGLNCFRMGMSALALALAGSPAFATDAEGVWMREDGGAKVEFASCGPALCGAISWLKSPDKAKGHVGQQVFTGMVRADQNSWAGTAFNPDDGRTYSGKMVLSGKRLRTSGCVLGGLICKSVNWVRAN